MNNMTHELAREYRSIYESYQMVMQTDFGKKLREKLDDIDTNASNKALRGDTPENTNVFFESRGRVGAIFQIRQMFIEIEKNNNDAVTWQTANPPQESA